MKNLTKLIIALMLVSLTVVGCTNQSSTANDDQNNAEDSEMIAESTPGVQNKVFENEYVKALKVSLEPNQHIPWHEGGPRLVYSLTDYSIRFAEDPDDTTTKEESFQKKEVHWHTESVHKVENTGNSVAEFMIFMRKPATFPESAKYTSQSNVENVQPKGTEVLLENNAVHVTKVMLSSGEKAPMHVGTKRLIYSLSDYTITYNSPDQAATKKSYNKGDVHWHEGGEHAVENTGNKPAKFLVMEFKK